MSPVSEERGDRNLERLTTASFERFIEEHAEADPAELALRLRGKVDIDLALACEQIRLRQRAREKLPSFHRAHCLYTRKAFEQASAERVAIYRAESLGGDRVLDGTAGLGADTWALSRSFREVRAVERDPQLAALLAENLRRLEAPPISIACRSIESVLEESDGEDLVFLDPDRRLSGARVAAIEESSPDVRALWPLLRQVARRVIVKLSPLLDPKSVVAALPAVVEIAVISLDNEVKELQVEIAASGAESEVRLRAVDLGAGEPRELLASLDAVHLADRVRTPDVEGDFLFEPGHAVLRAGLAAEQSARAGLRLLDAASGLSISDRDPAEGSAYDACIGRVFRVRAVLPFREKRFARDLAELGIDAAAIVRRGFRRSYAELRKRSRLGEGGEAHVFFTETAAGPQIYVCERVASGDAR